MESNSCPGFKAAGIAAGIKKNGLKDLGIIFSDIPANTAGVFTRNRVQAAPVLLDRERIQSGRCQGIIVNSGNANCCNGEQGMVDAINTTRMAAEILDIPEGLMLVASTGVIGQPMPMEKVKTGIPKLIKSLRIDGFSDIAEAIMTTDTVPKIVTRQGYLNKTAYSVLGIAKGSGMIRPNMATMLCFLCTDLNVATDVLKQTLSTAVDRSLNRITIDGDTSTNDTALIFANGKSGVTVENENDQAVFQAVLDDVMIHLSKALVKDGEGVTKLVEVEVRGSETAYHARAVADTIAHSNLVKTALFGQDANWGRIMAAAGRSGVPVAAEKIDIFFNDVQMVGNGIGKGAIAEAQGSLVLKKPEFKILVDLNMGSASASVLTCDFSMDYVKINANYRT